MRRVEGMIERHGQLVRVIGELGKSLEGDVADIGVALEAGMKMCAECRII